MPVLTQAGAPRTVTAELGPVPAAFTTEQAKALGITEKVSSFTTHFASAASGTNIRVVAAKVDGALVKPGETFSLNGFTGPRGTAQGYVPAARDQRRPAGQGGRRRHQPVRDHDVQRHVLRRPRRTCTTRRTASTSAATRPAARRPSTRASSTCSGRTTATTGIYVRHPVVPGHASPSRSTERKHYDIESVERPAPQRHAARRAGQARHDGTASRSPAPGLRHHRHPGVPGPELRRGAQAGELPHPLRRRGDHPLRRRRPGRPDGTTPAAPPAGGRRAVARSARSAAAAARGLSPRPPGDGAASSPGRRRRRRRAHWAGEHRPALGLPAPPGTPSERRRPAPAPTAARAGRRSGRLAAGRPAPRCRCRCSARRVAKAWQDRILGLSAEAAFWQILSVPPLLIGLLGSLGYLGTLIGGASVHQIEDRLLDAVGRGAHPRRRRLPGPAHPDRHPRLRPAGRRQPRVSCCRCGPARRRRRRS